MADKCFAHLATIYFSAMSISSRGKGRDVAHIPPQVASTSLSSEPQTSLQLRCFIEDDSNPFTIRVSVNRDIGDLQELIHERKKYLLTRSGVDPDDLVLFRVRNSYARMQRRQ